MNILIACEYSGTVRDAFIARGHRAISCDLLPTDKYGPHYQGDVRDILDLEWDMVIAHPECTYLTNSGVCHLHTDESRWDKLDAGSDFFNLFLKLDHVPKVVVENPVMHKHAIARLHRQQKQSQCVQPYNYGEDASKRTCLWIKGLPDLEKCEYVPPSHHGKNGKKVYANQTPSGQNKLGPSKDRWKERSRTYKGIAEAMADQWG